MLNLTEQQCVKQIKVKKIQTKKSAVSLTDKMISEFVKRKNKLQLFHLKESIEPSHKKKIKNSDAFAYNNLTLDEKREHRKQFGEAVMKYWQKSRGFINQEKFLAKMSCLDFVPSKELID